MQTSAQDVDVNVLVDAALSSHPDKTGQLLFVLNAIQDECGYIPKAAIEAISHKMGITVDVIKDWCEAFSFFSLTPTGRYVIDVCDGTACHTQGASKLVSEFERLLGINCGETTPDGLFTLRTVNCVGACGMAPVVVADGKAWGRVKVSSVADIAHSVEGLD